MTKLHERMSVGGLALVALIFRLWHLQYPKGFVFDEVYYAQNANSLLHHGVEIDPKTHLAQFIVHPPIGKWVIAAEMPILQQALATLIGRSVLSGLGMRAQRMVTQASGRMEVWSTAFHNSASVWNHS